jgi:hypothetical protein
MEAAHDMLNKSPTNWQKPDDIKTAPAYVVRTHVGVGSVEPSPSSDIFPSWYQPKTHNISYTIDKVSKKLATSCTPTLAKLFAGNSNASSFSVDQFVDGGGSGSSGYNTSANDDVHQCSDRKPAVSVTVARIDSENGDTTGADMCGDGCAVTITVSQGTHPLTSKNFPGKVSLTINGNVVKTFNITQGGLQSFTYNFKPGKKSGTSTITAQATDGVLYQGSDSASVSNKSGGNGGENNGDGDPFDPFH